MADIDKDMQKVYRCAKTKKKQLFDVTQQSHSSHRPVLWADVALKVD